MSGEVLDPLARVDDAAPPSVIRGIPVVDEPGIGALTLPGFLREVTARFGPREALVMHEDGRETRWSYDELWAQAAAVARALIAGGLSKGGRVGVLMTNRPEWIAATFGAAMAGGVPVGLSTFSTPPELDHLLRAADLSVLLIERIVLKKDFAAILRNLDSGFGDATPGTPVSLAYPYLRNVAMVGGDAAEGAIETWDAFLARGAGVPDARVDAIAATVKPSDPGLLFFSSGSTSKPKGILNAHRAVCLQLWRWPRFFGVGDDVRSWSANGFFWSGNFAQALGSTLASGGSLVLQATFDAVEALVLIERERVTLPIAWPHQWKQLGDAPGFAEADLSSLRYINPETDVGRHPTVSSTWQEPICAYGNTETFTISSIFPSGTPPERIGRSSGEPQAGMTFKIVDPMSGETVPIGTRGEIAVKGATLMLGYLGVPLDETLDEAGFFRTGDGGWVDGENRLYWEGRLSDIIKTGGANVSPLEIDETVMACPGVKRSQTVGVPHETLGELVVACVIPYDGVTLDEAAVRDFAKARLASYKVPRRVLFFAEDELALTGTAKIKAGELRKVAAARLAAD